MQLLATNKWSGRGTLSQPLSAGPAAPDQAHSQSATVQLVQALASESQARSPEQEEQTEASPSQLMQSSGQATHSPSTKP